MELGERFRNAARRTMTAVTDSIQWNVPRMGGIDPMDGISKFFSLALLVVFSSCSHFSGPSLHSDEVGILAITNLHGEVLPYEGYGGLAKLGAWIDTEKSRLGSRQVLVLAGGDHWEGTLLSDLDNGQCVFEGLEALGVAAYGVGEKDFMHPQFSNYAQRARAPFLVANPNVSANVLNVYRSVLLRAGDSLVGVTSALDRPGWQEAVQRSAEALRREGAHYVVAFAPITKGAKQIRNVDLVISTREKELGAETAASHAAVFPGRAGVFAYTVTLSRQRPPSASGPHLVSAESGSDWSVQKAINAGLERTEAARLARIGNITQDRAAVAIAADAVRARTGVDVAILHPGAASGVWRAGPIAREALHQSVAIDERLVAMTLSGHELTRLLRVLNSGARGTASISGLRVEAGDLETRGKGTDLNRDGKIEYWEINRIRKILTPEGKKFNPNKSYRVVMPEYLAKGGDDLEWVIANLHPAKIEPLPLTLRTAIEDHLKSDTLK